MSGALAKEKEALAKEEGKLKKLLAAIKKFMAKEFLWVLFAALLAIPIAFIMTYTLETYAKDIVTYLNEFLKGKPLFIASYVLSIAGIYFTRAVVGAIETMVKKDKSS